MLFHNFASVEIKTKILGFIQNDLKLESSCEVSPEDLPKTLALFSAPPNPALGDLAFPCFAMSKVLKKSPADIAQKLAQSTMSQDLPFVASVQAQGPYLNIHLNREWFTQAVLAQVVKQGRAYGDSTWGSEKTAVIDFSSPNIAKHLAFHHLRSTVIGHSLRNIFQALGYHTLAINHLGDWGTQFGKLMVAYRAWGQGGLGDDPVGTLNALYVRFQKEAKITPELNDQARAAFQALEAGDVETRKLWEEFREISLKTFERVYQRLGITFDVVRGESYFVDQIQPLLETLQQKNLSEMSEGALIVKLAAFNMPPCLLKKGDDTTLYATRDLCAALDRYREYQFEHLFYVVDQGQSLHFQQVFKVLELMGVPWVKKAEHVPFGIIKFAGAKTRTRDGGIILLEDVLDQAHELIAQKIQEKNPDLKNLQATAEAVGVGAIIFADLSGRRKTDINFDWDEMLNFEGRTGPYVQYSHARASSILAKGGDFSGADLGRLTLEAEWELVKTLGQFPESLLKAATDREPSVMADYALSLCEAFHRYHAAGKSDVSCRVLTEDQEVRKARLQLTHCTQLVLARALAILGLVAPQEM